MTESLFRAAGGRLPRSPAARRVPPAAEGRAGAVAAAGGRGPGAARILYQDVLDRAVRCRDPFVRLRRRWIVRRLAPDCSRIELAALPEVRDERRLLRAMGRETANVHLGSAKVKRPAADLARRSQGWLRRAAAVMHETVVEDRRARRLSASGGSGTTAAR